MGGAWDAGILEKTRALRCWCVRAGKLPHTWGKRSVQDLHKCVFASMWDLRKTPTHARQRNSGIPRVQNNPPLKNAQVRQCPRKAVLHSHSLSHIHSDKLRRTEMGNTHDAWKEEKLRRLEERKKSSRVLWSKKCYLTIFSVAE